MAGPNFPDGKNHRVLRDSDIMITDEVYVLFLPLFFVLSCVLLLVASSREMKMGSASPVRAVFKVYFTRSFGLFLGFLLVVDYPIRFANLVCNAPTAGLCATAMALGAALGCKFQQKAQTALMGALLFSWVLSALLGPFIG